MFGWIQKKLKGNKESESKRSNIPFDNESRERCREEFIDWPHGLLAIGTFGINNNSNNSSKENADERSDLDEENLTLEEVSQLGKEIGSLEGEKLLKCIASLEVVDRSEGSKNGDTRRLQRSRSDMINKKSLTFLLKKVFVCRSRLAPAAGSLSLADQVPESRIEKILRAIIHKKIHPQSCSPKGSAKKYLKNRSQMPNSSKEDDEMEMEMDNGGRWVKTDSEYIVLEI